MTKKHNQIQVKKQSQPQEPVQVQVEQAKQELVQKASKPLEKFLPHEKYIIRKTKLITKKKNQAIEFVKLDKFQIAKAIDCLKKFDSQNNSQVNLFTQDGFIYLELDLSKVPTHYSIRPVQIQLPHPIYDQKFNSRFTIFTSDPESAFTDKIQNLDIPQIADVVGYEKVKKEYKENKDKLKLISANDMFFCDWKIYNLLRQPLGKVFYDKKKYPFPIDCEDVPEELKSKFSSYQDYLNDLSNYTYFMMGNGPVYSLKIGRISMQTPELVKNIMRGVYRVIPHILTKEMTPDVIRQITIKTFNSPSLPIYNYLGASQVKAYKTQEQKISSSAKRTEKKKIENQPNKQKEQKPNKN